MNLLTEWLRTAKSVFTSPGKHFQQEQRMNGTDYPLKFALISLVIAGVLDFLAGIISGIAVPTGSLSFIALVAEVIQTTFKGIIGVFFHAAYLHVFVYLFGGRGYQKTLAAAGYAYAVLPVISAIYYLTLIGTITGINILWSVAALLAIAVFLWALVIEYRAVQNFHGLSSLKAAMSIILPMALLLLLLIGTIAASYATLAP